MKEVYIYGAGKLGQKCYEEVRKRGWYCKGFVVSSKKGNPDTVLELPVIGMEELRANMNCIVAVKDEYRHVVLNNLFRQNIPDAELYKSDGGGYKSFLRITTSNSLREIGTGYGAYTISDDLPPAPVVFSFGVGEDIQFETEIIHEYPEAKIFAFDPTPRSIAFMKSQNTGEITFLPFGLSDKNETEIFYMPMNEEYVSCSVIKHEGVGRKEIPVKMRTLAILMEQCNVTSLDILKMDIEGSEFKVIPQILASGIEIRQILVELHERFTPEPQKVFENTMRQFYEAGYKLIYVSGSAEEFTFIK